MAASNTLALNATGAEVTLEVFSGRPNPSWTLSPDATADLLRRLKALEATNEAPKPFDGLGYRAVQVELREQAKVTAVVSISHGFATVDAAGHQSHFSDTGRGLEAWLVNTGSQHVPADVLRYVTGEIAKSH